MNARRFSGDIDRLRASQRVAHLEVDRVVDLSLAEPTPRSLLDVGTGSGLFAEAFAARGLAVAGVDLREDMLDAARQFVPGGDFRQAHMETLPFPDESFDLVFMGVVLHEADHLANALSEAYRTTRQRVMILEWPYEKAEFGPPLDHRLRPQQVLDTARKVGFNNVAHTALNPMILFRLEKAALL